MASTPPFVASASFVWPANPLPSFKQLAKAAAYK